MSIWQILIIGAIGLLLKYVLSVILSNIQSKEEGKCILAKRTYGAMSAPKKNNDRSLLAVRKYGNQANRG